MSPSSTSAPPTARDLRERLEATQGRVKALRHLLSTQAPTSPLPGDLERLASLKAELELLEGRQAEASRRCESARRARDGAEKLSLREAPPVVVTALVPAALALGLIGGGLACFWLLDSGFARQWPLLSAATGVVVSGAFLLRAGWRLGRVSGAREL